MVWKTEALRPWINVDAALLCLAFKLVRYSPSEPVLQPTFGILHSNVAYHGTVETYSWLTNKRSARTRLAVVLRQRERIFAVPIAKE